MRDRFSLSFRQRVRLRDVTREMFGSQATGRGMTGRGMGEINMHMPIRAYFVVLVVLIAALLAGCGSSSKTSSSSTNASAATTTTGAKVATTTGTKAAKGPNAGHFKRAGARVSSPAFKAALAKFATCLRQNGVNIAPPNTSGKGPV